MYQINELLEIPKNILSLTEYVNHILSYRTRNVRDKIITGEFEVPFDSKKIAGFYNSKHAKALNSGSVIVSNLINEFLMKYTNERETNLVKILIKIFLSK